MSASSEKILLLIVELENRIQEERVLGKNTELLEEQIVKLRQELSVLNEALTSPSYVLKG